MGTPILHDKINFTSVISSKLAKINIDYLEKHSQIKRANSQGASHLEAGVVVLINCTEKSREPEYVFQLIKRSSKVAQGGDISCPGGMLNPKVDNIFSIFFKTGLIPAMRGVKIKYKDKNILPLTRLFLANSLREAWEEIGLNPYNVSFLGALPTYSLSSFTRTIYPLVCLTHNPFEYKLNSEVEKVVEIPLSFFFETSNYAWLQVTTPEGSNAYDEKSKFPCLTIPDKKGDYDILWGATFYIITNFLSIVCDKRLPVPSAERIFKKTITASYLTGGR
ncbi:MAG: CoA pyrophosphatase [Syntrophaceae bacterium]|nr:CoA pyrophosphatase [Syntrophaceae bacterium]